LNRKEVSVPEILDNTLQLRKLDPQEMLSVVGETPAQCRAARADGLAAPVDKKILKKIDGLIFSGVGGSAIGGDFVAAYLRPNVPFPVVVNRNYDLPGWVSRNTLVICSSYSGNTEETLNVFHQAVERRSKLLIVASGGELLRQAKLRRASVCELPIGFQPRAALSHSYVKILSILEKAGLKLSLKGDFEEGMDLLERLSGQYHESIPLKKNPAKQLAAFWLDKTPILYAGEGYAAMAYRWKCQLNENAKQIAVCGSVPEMNHNEILGYTASPGLLRKASVLFLRSRLHDHVRVQKRFDIMKTILRREKMDLREVWMEGRSVLAQTLATIYLADYASVYLALLKKIDPESVGLIDELKTRMARS